MIGGNAFLVIAKILPLTGIEWQVSFLPTSPSPRAPMVSAHSCLVECLDVHPDELVKLREIAD